MTCVMCGGVVVVCRTRKTYEQKLEEEERALDIASVNSLPDTLLPANGKERENPASSVHDPDDSD